MKTRWKWDHSRSAITLVEVLVCLAIVGAVLALLLPAVTAVREATFGVQCKNNLRQIGMAMQQYLESRGTFPRSATTTSWPIAIAPYLEQDALFRAYDHQHDPYTSLANAALGIQRLSVFLCPSDNEARLHPSNWVVANYACSLEMLGSPLSKCTDGTSQTGLAVEITSAQGLAWITGPSMIFGPQDAIHKKYLHVLFADGAVHAIPTTVVETLMAPIGTPNGGEIVNIDF